MTLWLSRLLSLARHGLRDTMAPWLVVSLSLHAGLIAAILPDPEGEEPALTAGSVFAVDVLIVEGPDDRSTTATGETGDLTATPDVARKAERRGGKAAPREPVSQPGPPAAAESAPPEDAIPAPRQPPAQTVAVTAKAPTATAAPIILAPRPRRKPAPPPVKPAAQPKPGPDSPSASTAHAAGSKPDEASAGVATATPGPSLPSSAPSGGSHGASPQPGNPKPVYPYNARRQGRQGRVVLRVEVLPDGIAGAVTIDRSSGYASLDEAAVAAVRKWRFRPAHRGGAAVATNVRVPIRFSLR